MIFTTAKKGGNIPLTLVCQKNVGAFCCCSFVVSTEYLLTIFSDKCSKVTVTIRNSTISEREYEKLLGIAFDKTLSFRKHVENLCRKTN